MPFDWLPAVAAQLEPKTTMDLTKPQGVAPEADRQFPVARLQKWELGVIALILLIAGGVRIYQLGHLSLWLDEIFSIATSSGHYPDIWPLEMNRVVINAP